MSGPPPNYYGFTQGSPYYPGGVPACPGAPPTHFPSAPYPGAPPTQVQCPGAPPTHFPSASYPGAPPTQVQRPGALPTYFHPPQHFPVTSESNYYPTGETHFTSAFVSESNAQKFSQGPRWIHWQKGNILPAQAVEAGYDVDRTKIYVGRLHHKGDLIPAKVIPQKNVAYVSYDGKELPFHSCEVLCQGHVNWVRHSSGRVPAGAIPVGRTLSGESLYAARVHYKGSLTVGKVHPSHGVCYIPFGGTEISHQEYEVLTS